MVIFPGEVLAFQNIERQAHALRAPAPGEDDLEGGRMTGVGTPGSRKDDFEGPDDGVVLPDQVLTLSLAVTVERIDGGKLQRDLGRCHSGPSRQGGSGPPISVRMIYAGKSHRDRDGGLLPHAVPA